MKKIPLTQGKVAIVDDEDFEELSKHKWHVHKGGHAYYAVRCIRRKDGTYTTQDMHRVILKPPDGVDCDHISGDGLDNRRENLRTCSKQENQFNRRPQLGCASHYKGVHKRGESWGAQIVVDYKAIYLGKYPTQELAAEAYDNAARENFGEFARLNYKV